MGYFMFHLHVAQRVAAVRGGICDEAAYYLGALAPDAAAYHPGGRRADKWDAHFAAGGEAWGEILDDTAWRRSILRQMPLLRGAAGADFLLGYFTHVWADTWNNERLWTPTRLAGQATPGLTDRFLADVYEIDSILMEELEDRERLFALLRRPCREGLPFAPAADIGRLTADMLDRLYAYRHPVPGYPFEIVRPETTRALIGQIVHDILTQLDTNDTFS